jgi:hypothetical protein
VPKTREEPLATEGQRETDIQSAVSSRGSEQQRGTMMMTNGEAGRGTRVAAVVVVAVVAAGVVLAWAVLGARVAGAAFPGQNGKIAFTSERDGNQEVYVMDPDGQNQTNLSNNAGADYQPDWGPLQDDPPPTIPPPTIPVVAGSQSQSACLGYNTGRITLKVGGADQSSTLSATSSNPRLLPTNNITFSGTGEIRTATIKTRSGRTGTSTVTITLTEGEMSASVAVTVKAGGDGRNTLNGTSGADLLLA